MGKQSAKPLRDAVAVANEAGKLLLTYLSRPLEIEEKELRADIVTQADRESEHFIFDRLHRLYPHAALLGEELGAAEGSSDERWIVDPLDGTTNFAHGYPLFCVSIAYERGGIVEAGVIYAPAMKELFAAGRGSGVTLNGRPLHVSKIDRLASALVCTGFQPANFQRNGAYYGLASAHTQGVRRDGTAALDLAYVAAGRFDVFWEFDLHAWDVAAGVLIVREAGGTVSRIDGGDHDLASDSVLASNGLIHEELRTLFQRV